MEYPILVVFDGTSHYIIPAEDFNPEEEEITNGFFSLEAADEWMDEVYHAYQFNQ